MKGRPGALALQAANREGSESAQTGEAPVIAAYSTEVAEARAIAGRIEQLVQQGVRAEDIAVLYRVNAQAAVLETALGDAGVSYQVRGA
jgi:DNA helicase-2/ATP-dependent DNA helicase PcrA